MIYRALDKAAAAVIVLLGGAAMSRSAHAQSMGVNMDNYTITSQFNNTSYQLVNPTDPAGSLVIRQNANRTSITLSDRQGGTLECKIDGDGATRTRVWISPNGGENTPAPDAKLENIDRQPMQEFAREFSLFTAGGTTIFPSGQAITLPDSLQKATEAALGPLQNCLHAHDVFPRGPQRTSLEIGNLAYMTQPGIKYTPG